MKWRGIHRDSIDVSKTTEEGLLLINGRFKVDGELRRRRGMARSNIIKKDNGITNLSGFSAFQSNVMAALVDGSNLQGYQQPAALWGDNTDYTPITPTIPTWIFKTGIGYVNTYARVKAYTTIGGALNPGSSYYNFTSTFCGTPGTYLSQTSGVLEFDVWQALTDGAWSDTLTIQFDYGYDAPNIFSDTPVVVMGDFDNTSDQTVYYQEDLADNPGIYAGHCLSSLIVTRYVTFYDTGRISVSDTL